MGVASRKKQGSSKDESKPTRREMSAEIDSIAVEKQGKTREEIEAEVENEAEPFVSWALGTIVRMIAIIYIGWSAYEIRTFAIRDYGRVIHEFDPWFNFRATQYLDMNGWKKFFHWYDYMSWYPLGRPVGTTIYPGMQITSVVIKNTLHSLGIKMSLNDVCVFVPCWFGVVATMFLGLLTSECTKSAWAGIFGASMMAIIPAHIMRSVGGGYDNESIAVSAMMMTFYFWVRSLRTKDSWPIGVVTGIAYTYMVAVWGGFVFVLNMIAIHAAALVVLGRYSTKLYRAYTLFYVIGTFGATCVPVVQWTPLKSLEQLPACAVFIVYQLLEFCEMFARSKKMDNVQKLQLKFSTFAAAGLAAFVVIGALAPTGYFGPISSRIRGVFVKHTRTGNPLVDSVAEHQPASPEAYWQFLHYAYYVGPVGFVLLTKNWLQSRRVDGAYFLWIYALLAWFFSGKMMRLIIIAGPIASALSGMVFGTLFEYTLEQIMFFVGLGAKKEEETSNSILAKVKASFMGIYNFFPVRIVRMVASIMACMYCVHYSHDFRERSHQMAMGMSNPQIMMKASLRDGTQVMVDDYREAYFWLRDKTPKDARVMAWWDYGYQITGIGNRTTIADGNTWNHEHIATLGRCLTSPVKEAHRIIRHLADYVLIWTGGGGDDLAKSPHMARIGNSVYEDICPGDPTCRGFGFDHQGHPTPMMEASLLYNLHSHRMKPGVEADPNRFQEVFTSKYAKVRIFRVMSISKESKVWVADPKNRICDAPGSWYCKGQYPPALSKIMKMKRDFKQLEDFNTAKDAKAEQYQKDYMARMETSSRRV